MNPNVIAGVAATLLVPLAASADEIPTIESFFGATNVNAITGHGRLSVGVSEDGDVTVLTWPNPSYSDQLGYVSSNALDARRLPRLGAPEGAGMFLGLVVERPAGRQIVWLRDPSLFVSSQGYGDDDGANPETHFASDELGLSVVVVDAVEPLAAQSLAADRFVRSVRITRSADSDVTAASLLTYANLSPLPPTARLPELPLVDWGMDGRNDYAALWDPSVGAVVQFHPEDDLIVNELADVLVAPTSTYGAVGQTLVDGPPDAVSLAALADGLDAAHSAGAYLGLTTIPAPDSHQIGLDATPLCEAVSDIIDNLQALPARFPELQIPVEPGVIEAARCRVPDPPIPDREGWQHRPDDALADAADGELSGSDLAAGEVNAALRTPLAFDTTGLATASVVLVAAANHAEVRAGLARAGASEVHAAANRAMHEWLDARTLPAIGLRGYRLWPAAR